MSRWRSRVHRPSSYNCEACQYTWSHQASSRFTHGPMLQGVKSWCSLMQLAYHVPMETFRSSGVVAPRVGPNVHGGQSVTRSQPIVPFSRPSLYISQAACSARVLLVRYIAAGLASVPFSFTSAGSVSFQSASVKTTGFGRRGSTTAASEET